MNKLYQIVWSKGLQQWVVTSELSKSCGTGTSVKGVAGKFSAVKFYFLPIALGLFLNGWHSAFAAPPIPSQLPVGGQVVAGQADINQTPNVLNVNQSSQRAVIEWQSFNLGKNAQVNFNQPSSDSVTLNRVLDNNPSQIFGKISSPGQVYLINPNGAYFAPSASLEVGSFLASTHKISTEDFMAGRSTLVRDGATGRILNEGQIKASLGGYIALLAPEVRNNGLLIAELGRVVMAAGEAYTLKFEGAGLLSNVVVSPSTINSYVENGNAVIAPGGLIILSAQVANRMLSGVVENTGSLQANAMVNDGGRILLRSTDKINNSGSIQANASLNNTGKGGNVTLIADLDNPNSQTIVSGSISAKGGGLGGDGGFIETSASNLNIQSGANISATAPLGDAGVWLLDPVNITIQGGGTTPVSSAGGTVSPADSPSTVDVATLNAALTAGNSVTITTTAGGSGSQEGDITIDAPISKTGGSSGSLTLNADRNIIINSSITASGAGVTLPVTLTAAGNISGNTNGNINTNGGTLTLSSGVNLSSSNTLADIQGVISGAGAVTKNGAGSLKLSGANTYTGDTTVNGGILYAGSSNAVGYSNVRVANNSSKFNLNGNNLNIKELRLGGGSSEVILSSGATLTLNTAIQAVDTDMSRINGIISGNGNIIINGNGKLILVSSAASTYSGTTTVNNGATFQLGNGEGNNKQPYTGTGDIILDRGFFTLSNLGKDQTLSNLIRGNGNLNVDVTSKTITLTGNNTYQGTTTITSGTLQIGNGFSTGTLGTGSVTNNSSLIFNRNADTAINNNISGSGSILANITGNLTINNGFQLRSTANDIILSATGNFTNNAGNAALSTTGANKRWVIYSADPSTNTFGGLTSGNKALWGSTYASLPPASVGSGNRYVFSTAGGSVTASTTAASKFYGDDPVTLSPTYSYSGKAFSPDNTFGVYANSDFSDALTTIPTVTSTGNSIVANVGSNYAYSITGGTAKSGFSYSLSSNNAFFTVNKATVTLSNITKTYDGSDGKGNTTLVISGVRGQTLDFTDVAFFDRNVGNPNNYLTSLTLKNGVGSLESNYQLPALNVNTAFATITKAPLVISATSQTREYNGDITSSAPPTYGTLFGTDTLSGLRQSYASKNVLGAGASTLNVNAGYTLSDSNNGQNYDVTLMPAAGTITKAPLVISATSQTREYNGDTTSSATPTYGTLYGSDSISGLTQSYASKNVLGTGASTLNVNAGYTLNDTNGGQNYLVSLTSAAGTITPKAISLFGLTAANKTYDGNSEATITSFGVFQYGAQSSIDNKIYTGDSVELIHNNATATFADPSVGPNKTVTVSGLRLNNNNYSIANQTTSAEITPRILDLLSITGERRYNGTTLFTYEDFIVSGAVRNETVTLTAGTAYTTSPNIGDYALRPLYGLAISVSGGSASNYALPTAANLSITKAPLTISATSQTRQYTGDTTSSSLPTYGTLYGNDSLSGLTQAYASKNVLGTNQSVLNVNSGYTLNDGNGGRNYEVSLVSAPGTITKAPLVISATSQTREYNGDTTSSAAPTHGTLYGSDSLSGLTQSYASKNVLGENQSVLNVNSGYTLSDGNDGRNYQVSLVSAPGTITPAPLTISATSQTRQYNGDSTSNATPTYGTLYGSDSLSGLTQSYASKNVLGENQSTLNVNSGYTLSDGNGGQNYQVSLVSAPGTITPAPLTISATSQTRQYNGDSTSNATPTYGTLYGSDSLSGLTQSYASKNVLGENQSTLNVNNGYTLSDGNGGQNYTVTLASAAGTITPAPLTISATSQTRQYNGDITSSATPTYGTLYGSDSLSGLTQSYASKNVLGENQSTLNVNSGYTLNDTNGGQNYTVTLASAAGTITPAPLTISATSQTREYNGDTTSSATPTYETLYGSDSVIGLSQSYASKNVLGENQSTLNVNSGYTLNDTNGGQNYTVTLESAAGTITKANLNINEVSVSNKVYDGTRTASLNGGAVKALNQDDVILINENATGVFESKDAGESRVVLASGYTIKGIDSNNYNLVQPIGLFADISPKPLLVIANNDVRSYDNTAYIGGKGVTLNGLVASDTLADLNGNLSYVGSSQGAINTGTYSIIPSGLNSTNYKIQFISGQLQIIGNPPVVTSNSLSTVKNSDQNINSKSIVKIGETSISNNLVTNVIANLAVLSEPKTGNAGIAVLDVNRDAIQDGKLIYLRIPDQLFDFKSVEIDSKYFTEWFGFDTSKKTFIVRSVPLDVDFIIVPIKIDGENWNFQFNFKK